MKKLKELIIGVIIGLSLFGGVVVAANYLSSDISYTPNNTNWNTNVSSALDDIYANPTFKKVCELKSGNALTVSSLYECDLGDGVKRNFYILKVENNIVKLIMQHNLLEGTIDPTLDWNDSMNYFVSGDGVSLKNSWTNILEVDLPSVQDIIDAAGVQNWEVGSASNTNYYHMEDPSQRWLFNYTAECNYYGCDSDAGVPEVNSLGASEAWGYWSRDTVAYCYDDQEIGHAWMVNSGGYITSWKPDHTDFGLRPVITILKSNLY